MKKILLVLLFLTVVLDTIGQRFYLKHVGIEESKYVRPRKPDTCFYLSYNDTILGYSSPLWVPYPYAKSEWDKEPTCTITLYSGKVFNVENYGYRYINKDGTVLCIWGNKTIPEQDTTVFLIYNGNGQLIHRDERFGWSSFYPAAISDEGYLAARVKVKGKDENRLILISPNGEIVFQKEVEHVLSITISSDAQYIACVLTKKDSDNNYFQVYDNKGNLIAERIVEKKTILFPEINIINNEFVLITCDNYLMLYNFITKQVIIKTYNYVFEHIEKKSFLYYPNLSIIIVVPAVPKYVGFYHILILDLIDKTVTTKILKGAQAIKPTEKIDNYHFKVNLIYKTYIYEIIEN